MTTTIDPNKRTLVAGFGWVVRTKNLISENTFWVDFTTGGVAKADQILVDLKNAETDPSVNYAYSQFRVYFEDGGRLAPKYRYDLQQCEVLYNFYTPILAPLTFAAKPEYWTQEGFNNADEWRASLT